MRCIGHRGATGPPLPPLRPRTASRTRSTPCLLPFPNNLFTRRDQLDADRAAGAPAGRRDAGQQQGPARQRRAVRPQRRLQPRQRVIVHIPGLDNRAGAAHGPGAVPLTNMAPGVRAQAPADRDDRRGHRQAPADLGRARRQRRATPQDTNLLIHPGKNFLEGHTYVVALRNLRMPAGHADRRADAGSSGCATAARCRGRALPARPLRADLPRARARAGIARRTSTRRGTSRSPRARA